jgi:hypothetical protein
LRLALEFPRRLKEEVDRLGRNINWSEEIRRFLKERVKQLQRQRILEEARRIIERVPEAPRGTAARYVREDRDSN